MQLRTPYLIFLGDADSGPFAKTAYGVHDWAPEACLAQTRLPGCPVDLGLPEMTPAQAAAAGAKSMLLGVAPRGGQIPASWRAVLLQAADAGLDIINGMHTALADIPGLAAAAQSSGSALNDVRRPRQIFPVGNGQKRPGKRLLTVGTDCVMGKKYTALALAKAMRARGIDAEFRATGQTGIMIAGAGVAIDAVVSDFVSGAAELLSPAAAAGHWDIVEGQGSLFHPSYAGVTLGLIHGTQPDVLILCHDPMRLHIKSLPDYPIPSLTVAAEKYLDAARLTNPAVRVAGVALNTSKLDAEACQRALAAASDELGLPSFDPMATTADLVIESILA